MAVRSGGLPLAIIPIAAGHTNIYNVCLRTFRAANRGELREKLAADAAAPHKSTAKLGHALPE